MINREDFGHLPMAQASRRRAFMYLGATWRKMLVQQPPVLRLGRWSASHAMMGEFHQFQLEEFPNGLRMAGLYDSAQDWARQAVSGFNVFWDTSAVTAYGSTRYGSWMEPVGKADIVLFCYMVVQCTDEYPYLQFEQTFTFAPSKKQRDNWRFYGLAKEGF
ncbi:hypothetical protein F4803DRAFT_551109 [Xylaria telfairii]|nr:hypothetical protein F4803DRAFT_551109 [Xylaria telfairii]